MSHAMIPEVGVIADHRPAMIPEVRGHRSSSLAIGPGDVLIDWPVAYVPNAKPNPQHRA